MPVVFFNQTAANGQPAEPFPNEPGDVPAPAAEPAPSDQPPVPQEGDPGAEPPPANLEQADAEDPFHQVIMRVAEQSHADAKSIKALTLALINQLTSTVCTVRMARDSIGRLGSNEIYPLALLKDLHEEAEALTIMLQPFSGDAELFKQHQAAIN